MKTLAILATVLMSLGCTPATEKEGSTIDEIKEKIENGETGEPQGDPEDSFVTEAMISTAEATELMVEKAAAYRKASMLKGKRNGVYVYSGGTFDAYVSRPEKLAARIAMLGFKDVYLSPGTSRITNASDALKRFIAACSGYKIDVYAIGASESSQYLANASKVTQDVNQIISYNGKVSANQRFAGISADIEPHTIHNKLSTTYPYTWDSVSNYGKGKDNDQLLKLTLERLSSAGTALHQAGLKLGEAIFYNYQIYFDQGQLEYGSTGQFLQSCDYLVTMAYLTTKESIWSKSEPGIKAAGKANSVSVCVKTRINEDSGSSIQSLGWNNLLEVAKYVNQKGSAYESYRGFDMFTFDGIETMWEWENDKN